MTATWTRDELAIIGATREVDIAPRRADGTLGRSTTVWVVRVGDDLYVRSYRGRGGTWYRAALGTHQGHLHALVAFTDNVLFGEVWARTELSAKERSLITVAALTTSGNTDQLVFHLAFAKQNGNTEAELIEAITHLAFYAGWPKTMAAMAVAK